jgi:hypothetical protein
MPLELSISVTKSQPYRRATTTDTYVEYRAKEYRYIEKKGNSD